MVAKWKRGAVKTVGGRVGCSLFASHAPRPTGEPAIAVTLRRDGEDLKTKEK